MAVLCEALSVIIRLPSVDRYFRGGRAAMVHVLPNPTYCTDDELLRVGFMTPDDVDEFIEVLVRNGLQFTPDDRKEGEDTRTFGQPEGDFIVVDQNLGVLGHCHWLECSRMRIGDDQWVTVAAATGPLLVHDNDTSPGSLVQAQDRRDELHTPVGWTFSGSMSESVNFVELDDMPRRMRFLREEPAYDVYWDTDLDREVYVGRTR